MSKNEKSKEDYFLPIVNKENNLTIKKIYLGSLKPNEINHSNFGNFLIH